MINKTLSTALVACFGSNALAAGSIVFDNTLPNQPHGTTTPVPLIAGHYTIDASNTGYLNGANLFESFATFIIAANETANFTNSTNLAINNVISRVTGIGSPNGLQPTTIDGNIASTIGHANFWFTNPAGVTLGGGATINVPAGLAIGSADYIKFADNSRWYALPSNTPTPSVLSTASPAAFGFLPNTTTGALTVQASALGSPAGSVWLASGGPLTIQGTSVTATSTSSDPGAITLTSASSVSTSNATITTGVSAGAAQVGNIDIAAPTITITGGSIDASSNSNASAGNISLTASGTDPQGGYALQVSGGAGIVSSSNLNGSPSAAGNVTLSAPAGTVQLGLPTDSAASGVSTNSNGGGGGPAGQIVIEGSSVTIDRGYLSALTQSTSNGAEPAISVIASTGPAVITGATLQTYTNYRAKAGDIAITAPAILVNAQSNLVADSVDAGNAGNITLTATGADPQGGFALQVSGGSSIVSAAKGGGNSSTNGGNVTLSAPKGTIQVGLPNDTAVTTINASAALGEGAVGSIDMKGLSVNLDQAHLNAATDSPTSPTSTQPAIDVVATGGPVTIVQGSQLSSTTTAAANAAGIAVSGPSILVTGGSTISAATSGSGNAGNISLTATGADPQGGYALQVSGGAGIFSDSNLGGSPGAAGNMTLSAPVGTVQLGLLTDSATSGVSTNSNGGPAGQIVIDGSSVTIDRANLSAFTQSTVNGPEPAISITASTGPAVITGATLQTYTNYRAKAGDIAITAPAILVNAQSSLVADSVDAGNAGNIALTATGADPQGGFALQVSGGSSIVSAAKGGGNSSTNGGNVTLSAPKGTIQVGLPSDAAVTTINASAGYGQGAVGSIDMKGLSVNLDQAHLNAATDSPTSPTSTQPAIDVVATGGPVTIMQASQLSSTTTAAANAADIAVSGPSILITGGSTVSAATSGSGNAGNIAMTASGVDSQSAPALQISGGSTISSDAQYGQKGANAGNISIAAGNGTVQLGLATDTAATQTLSRAGSTAGSVGSISVTGASVSLDQAQLLALSQSSVSPSASHPAVSLNATTGAVSLVASVLNSNTSGSADSGNINVSGASISMSGVSPVTGLSLISAATFGAGKAGNIALQASGADPAGGAALQMAGGAQILSESQPGLGNTGQSGNAGSISLTAPSGTIQIVSTGTRTQLSTLAGAQAGAAGAISITGRQIELDDALIDTTVSSTNTNTKGTLPPASVTLAATGGVSLSNSLIDLQTSGAVDAGSVSITGGTVSISGGLQLAPVSNSPFSLPLNTAIFTGTSSTGNGGNVSITAAGVLAVSNATISSQSIGSTGYGGQIALVGSGVLIDKQSLLSADYRNPGGNPGAAGSIAIAATGAAAANDPLQNNLTAATAGVVRIVDSGVTASNDGGIGASGNIGGFGQVFVGGSLPGQAPINTDNVIIAGSVVSTDVLDGGLGSNLTIQANRGVYIGTSPTGGFADPIARPSFPDPRSAVTRSLVSAQTDASAVSGGQIAISAAGGGVTIFNSNVDAGTTRTQSGIDISAAGGGAVTLTGAVLQSNTLNANRSGDITIAAGSVSSSENSTITAKTGGAGDAGNIVITASGSDPQGGAAVQLAGGTLVTSDAVNAQSGANAGSVSLVASNGSVQIGLPADPASSPTVISTSAGAAAGSAGQITLSGTGISLANAEVTTTTAGSMLSAAHGTIALTASGAIAVTGGSTIKADTSGAAPGGAIQFLTAGSVTIGGSGTAISSNTSGEGVGGDLDFGTAAKPVSSLTLSDGAAVSANASGSGPLAGQGGAIVVASAGSVALSGTGTALSSNSSNNARGGSVTITASSLSMLSGAAITADTSSAPVAAAAPARTRATVRATQLAPAVSGGSVVIATSGEVTLSGPGTTISANTTGAGSGGTVTITAGDLAMTDGANIATTATGAGNSGAILIGLGAGPSGSPGELFLADGTITTDAAASTGGDITINANNGAVELWNNSSINATAGKSGNGGNITIKDAGRAILQDSGVLARADSGNGGAINIRLLPGAVYIADSESLVSAQSNTGNNGTVTISAPQTDLNSALRAPDVGVATAPALAANTCKRDAAHSTFVREGRGGVAPEADDYLSGPVPSDIGVVHKADSGLRQRSATGQVTQLDVALPGCH